MPMQLYFSPGACSFVPHVLLEAAGADYEPIMVKLHKGEQNEPAYQAINPRGQVPVLVVQSDEPVAGAPVAINQVVAIIGYLNDCYPAMGYLPDQPMARAKVLETLAWMNNTVHPTFAHIFMPHKFTSNPQVHGDLKSHNTALLARQLGEIDTMVQHAAAAGMPYLASHHLGPLDAYALTLLRWGSMAGIDPAQFAALWAHVQTVAALPAVARVIQRERLQINLFKLA